MLKQKGYSLIELMTTIAVASVLITVALPGMQSFRLNSNMTGNLNELISGIHLARNTAITTNTRVTLCASSSGDNCEAVDWAEGWIAFVDRDSDQVVDANETVLRTGSEAEGVTISSGQYPAFLMYRPNGRAMKNFVSENSGRFTFCDKRGAEYAKAIIVDLSGRPRVADKDTPGVSLSCG
ncbi:MAG: GspH/FimT family pseudopilin [Woeseiaceae bacterium]|nr:GspH/FimT family pseudopilin [Woeseiaceae bacterium]